AQYPPGAGAGEITSDGPLALRHRACRVHSGPLSGHLAIIEMAIR
ncbi:hypothetical protein KWA17_004618, partial [Salmonella enterica]|nr:hypothetical protein [Salmonella enterica]